MRSPRAGRLGMSRVELWNCSLCWEVSPDSSSLRLRLQSFDHRCWVSHSKPISCDVQSLL